MSGKFALIIGNVEYSDPGLARLNAPGKDTEDLARVLKDRDICAFDDVKVLLNEPSGSAIETIDEFFDQRKPDDLLVLYFSGHGVRDEFGALYLAFKNTSRSRLRSTAVKSDYIREAMDQSRSKRQVVILDCCNSGAFPQGTKAEVGGIMGMTHAFQGYGRFVLTASDSTQFAWEGDQVIGKTENSLFTHFLVKGLEGEADYDSDGKITVDELYDYSYRQISKITPKQTPTKSSTKVEGEIVLRQFTRIEDVKPVPLPDPLIESIENPLADIRMGAVQQLLKLLSGKNLGRSRSARQTLEKIAAEDDSYRVRQAASQALESARQEAQEADEELREREEAQRLAMQKAEQERLEREKAEAKRQAEEAARRASAGLKKAESGTETEDKPEAPVRKAPGQKSEREPSRREGYVPAPLGTEQKVKEVRSPRQASYFIYLGIALILGIIIVCYAGFSQINRTLQNASSTMNAGNVAAAATQNAEGTAFSAQATDDAFEAIAAANATADSAQATENADATASAFQATNDAFSATEIINETVRAQATKDAKSFFDPFDDNSSGWFVGDWNKTSWDGLTSINNSIFTIEVTQVRDRFSQRVLFPGEVSANFDLRADGQSEGSAVPNSTTDKFCYGIYFREASDSYYAFYVCDQSYQVSFYDGSGWNTLIERTEISTISSSDWNTLRVIATGGDFELYINNVRVGNFSDSSNENGNMGVWFQTQGELQTGQIWFDNFILNNTE